MSRQLYITNDNSHTIYVPGLDEYYHSKFGAIKESKHVFINAGLKYLGRQNLKVFEIGFGTGLNMLLTIIEAERTGIITEYYTIDNYPLDISIINKLNYPDILKLKEEERNLFYRIHNEKWDANIKLTGNFRFIKIKNDITGYQIPFIYDLVYFDAFAPDKQPEMWSKDIFQKVYRNLNRNGILITYCAKGIVKRTLQSAGFQVEGIPGPPGKREMIRACKL
jgi:tRNA U34 5-methylaminomethyl-2-thiouridine-forming methyltransferase MnmC